MREISTGTAYEPSAMSNRRDPHQPWHRPVHLYPAFRLRRTTRFSFCRSVAGRGAGLTRQLAATRDRELFTDLATAFAASGGRPRNVLALSGGDARGAYGCGFLNGWRDAPSGRRPVFDVVTGVSTGALMATAAFLGTADDDQTLRRIYTTIHDRDVYDGPFTPGPPDSLFETAPLRRLIAGYITRETLYRVAAAHREGRRLYVATVGLDEGQMIIWPLSKIAADSTPDITDAVLERYRRILLAAAAIPLMFPPIEIDGDLQVDAGIREAIFLRPEMLGHSDTEGPTDTDRPAEPPTVYAIVNGKLGVAPRPVADDLLHIGVRSLELYTDSLVLMSLQNVAHMAECHTPPCRFKYIAIPSDIDAGPDPNPVTGMFNPEITQKLYVAGESSARQAGSPWREGLPRLDGGPEPISATPRHPDARILCGKSTSEHTAETNHATAISACLGVLPSASSASWRSSLSLRRGERQDARAATPRREKSVGPVV